MLSNVNMLDLENDLPDELISSSPWGLTDNMGTKPPAQGPGPGGLQNGIENADGTNHRQMQLNHLLQQVRVLFLLFVFTYLKMYMYTFFNNCLILDGDDRKNSEVILFSIVFRKKKLDVVTQKVLL